MAKMKIRIYQDNKPEPEKTITIPLAIIGIAMKFVPKKMKETLESKGMDVKFIADVAKSGEVQGEIRDSSGFLQYSPGLWRSSCRSWRTVSASSCAETASGAFVGSRPSNGPMVSVSASSATADIEPS